MLSIATFFPRPRLLPRSTRHTFDTGFKCDLHLPGSHLAYGFFSLQTFVATFQLHFVDCDQKPSGRAMASSAFSSRSSYLRHFVNVLYSALSHRMTTHAFLDSTGGNCYLHDEKQTQLSPFFPSTIESGHTPQFKTLRSENLTLLRSLSFISFSTCHIKLPYTFPVFSRSYVLP
jgi:hypothetical protein